MGRSTGDGALATATGRAGVRRRAGSESDITRTRHSLAPLRPSDGRAGASAAGGGRLRDN